LEESILLNREKLFLLIHEEIQKLREKSDVLYVSRVPRLTEEEIAMNLEVSERDNILQTKAAMGMNDAKKDIRKKSSATEPKQTSNRQQQ
jgi:hypothetical protein